MTGIRILVTESERIIAQRVYKLLTEAQFKVDLAIDGIRAQQLFERCSYDLLLIDVKLADISGCELCHQIKSKNALVPIIVMAFAPDDHKFEAFQADADDYFLMVADWRELLMRIKVLIRRSLQVILRENRISAGDIVMDLDSKEVFLGNTEILLSAREFLLLQYFLRNKNRVISRDEIVANLWGSACDGKELRVAAWMHSLRMKICTDKTRNFIYTVRGKGYMLAESLRSENHLRH
jgi:DNA-binding response OmpR family regulator